jgi:large subunit ribosomal protein L24
MSKAKMKIRKGDQVVILAGKDKGAKGEVLKTFPTDSRVLVAGVNIATKHTKPSQLTPGGVEKKEQPIHVSNVALADPKGGKATKVGYKVLKDGKRVRFARKSGETIG